MPDKKETLYQKEVVKQKRIQDSLLSEANAFRGEFVKQLLQLVTSAFGLVAALAWNELIKELITKYIQPFFGQSSGLVSLTIYALIVTLLAVMVTYQLSKLSKK